MQIRSMECQSLPGVTNTWQLIISEAAEGAIQDVSRMRSFILNFKMKRFRTLPKRHLIGFKGVPRVMQIGFKPGSWFDILV